MRTFHGVGEPQQAGGESHLVSIYIYIERERERERERKKNKLIF